MSADLEHLELVPERHEPRMLTAVDPDSTQDGDQEFRERATGWPPAAWRMLPTNARRLRPSSTMLFIVMLFLTWILLQPIYALIEQAQIPEAEWAYQATGIRQAQALGLSGAGVSVCIVDSGVQLQHPDLDHLVIRFSDFSGDSSEPVDYASDGHGTMIVGLLAADGVLKGSAPGVDLLVASALGAGDIGSEEAVTDAIRWCTANRADIISLSLGGEQSIEMPFENSAVEAVEDALRNGVFVVAAAGNDGGVHDDGRVAVPANVPAVIAVGAVDVGGELWEMSSRGDDLAGAGDNPRTSPDQKPEIIAPGVNVVSTWLDGGYSSSTGTSDATVFVTGALALVLEAHPELKPQWDNTDRTQCINLVKQALMDSAIPYAAQVSPHDDRYGYGNLNAIGWIEALNGSTSC